MFEDENYKRKVKKDEINYFSFLMELDEEKKSFEIINGLLIISYRQLSSEHIKE